jgi:glycosyltransferase involved in cell wall biosynthesis
MSSENSRTRVSVILPVRNGGSYLPLAVESVLQQTFGSFELLVIDDASSDGSISLLEPMATRDPRLRLLRNPGSGLVAALNFGLSQAQAEFVARMDADDIALPERLSRQVEFLETMPEISVVGTQVAFIDATGILTGEQPSFPTEPKEITRALIARGCVVRHPSVLARKTSLLSVGGYRPACDKAEDYDLWLRLVDGDRIANLPEVLLHYRVHPLQISNGINLQQRFSRDLALLAWRARRAGETDPLDNILQPVSFMQADHDALRSLPNAIDLLAAYSALAFFENLGSKQPSVSALEAVIRCAQQGLLGDGRKYRALSLVRCAHVAAKVGRWRLAGMAAQLALSLAPGRASRWLVGLGSLSSYQTT